SGVSRSVMGMPLKTADSRTCDSPTKARSPTKSSLRVKPGTAATASYRPVFRSTVPSVPEPDSQTHSRPPCQRGEWGIDRPRHRISPESTSIRMPPLALFGLQPAISFVSPSAVTYVGSPSTRPRPLRWQRSEGSSSVTNGGRQRGTKLDSGSSVARQEKRVFANHSSWDGFENHLTLSSDGFENRPTSPAPLSLS